MFPKPANSSAKELADAIQSNPEEAIKILAEHDRALTAAVRREDAKIAGLCESWYEGKREEAAKYAGEEILALITPDQQSALDAYRDSVLAPVREAAKKLRYYVEYGGNRGIPEEVLALLMNIIALKGSSDAAKEA